MLELINIIKKMIGDHPVLPFRTSSFTYASRYIMHGLLVSGTYKYINIFIYDITHLGSRPLYTLFLIVKIKIREKKRPYKS